MRQFLAGRRPSPAMAVAFVALLAALSGTAVALPDKNTVDSGDIKNGVVKSEDIKNGGVGSKDIKNGGVTTDDLKNNDVRSGDVRDNTLTGTDINESSLGRSQREHCEHRQQRRHREHREHREPSECRRASFDRSSSASHARTLRPRKGSLGGGVANPAH